MPAFPSLEWYQALADRMNGPDQHLFEMIGDADCRWCLRIQPDILRKRFLFGFVFDGTQCTEVVELDPKGDGSEFDPDFTLVSRYAIWADILHNSLRNDGADLEHTLNLLSIDDFPIHIEARDQMRADKFDRYGQTFQDFFDAGRHIDTEWIKPLPEGGVKELVAQFAKKRDQPD